MRKMTIRRRKGEWREEKREGESERTGKEKTKRRVRKKTEEKC